MIATLKYGLPLLLVLHLITATTATALLGGLVDGLVSEVVGTVVCVESSTLNIVNALLGQVQELLKQLGPLLQGVLQGVAG